MKFPLPLQAAAAIALLMLGSAREAAAAFAASLEVVGPSGTTRNYVLDNDVLDGFVAPAGYVQLADADPRLGFIGLGTFEPISGFLIEGSLQSATFASGSPGSLNILDSGSLAISNDSGGEVVASLVVSATGFVGPITTAFASGSVTWQNADGSTLDASWYDDAGNRQGAEGVDDLPGLLVHSATFTADGPSDADATASGPVAVSDGPLFSMTLGTILTTSDANDVADDGIFARVVNRGQTEQKVVVPEPPAIGLAITALAGWSARRRLHKEQLRKAGRLLHLG